MRILHVGNNATGSGGIASVISRHATRSGLPSKSICSYQQDANGAWRRNSASLKAGTTVLLYKPSDSLVIHVHLSQGGSLIREGLLVWLSRIRGHRGVVVTLHGSRTLQLSGLHRWALRLAIMPADVVHVLSAAHAKKLTQENSRLVTIPNDVSLPSETRRMHMRRQTIVFAGVIGYRKGVDLLLAAWSTIACEDWQLVLCGALERDAPADLRNAIRDSEAVEWRGLLNPTDLHQLLGESQIVVLPSRAEALPMTVCEAMSHGCAVIASDVGGVADLLGSGNTYLIPPGDVEALAEALQSLIENEAVRSAQGRENRLRAEKLFGPGCLDEQWAGTYRAALERRPSGLSHIIPMRKEKRGKPIA